MRGIKEVLLKIVTDRQIDAACDSGDLHADIICERIISALLKSDEPNILEDLIAARNEGIKIAANYCGEDLSTFEPVSKVRIDRE